MGDGGGRELWAALHRVLQPGRADHPAVKAQVKRQRASCHAADREGRRAAAAAAAAAANRSLGRRQRQVAQAGPNVCRRRVRVRARVCVCVCVCVCVNRAAAIAIAAADGAVAGVPDTTDIIVPQKSCRLLLALSYPKRKPASLRFCVLRSVDV